MLSKWTMFIVSNWLKQIADNIGMHYAHFKKNQFD